MTRLLHESSQILHLNSKLFYNCLEGITDDQAAVRISDHNNPLNWIAAHTVWARYNICALLGAKIENPYAGLFENFKPIEADVSYGTMEEIKSNWKTSTELLDEALVNSTEEHLLSESPRKFPVQDPTYVGVIAFLCQHESFQIGQMAFLKKYLTKDAMKY